MQKLPQIHFWSDRIDGSAATYHAVRGWGDRPSNGVFMLVARPPTGHLSWNQREAIREELERKLKERERILFNWYGRDWRNHLCATIYYGGERITVADHYEP